MKHTRLTEIFETLKTNPKILRKIKIFALVGIVGFLITGALMVWAGLSAINYVASSAIQAVQSPIAQSHVENLKTEIKSLPKLQAINCWGKAQTLLNIQPWLERPVRENLANLKVACFEQKPNICQGAQCEQMKELIHKAKRSFI